MTGELFGNKNDTKQQCKKGKDEREKSVSEEYRWLMRCEARDGRIKTVHAVLRRNYHLIIT